MIELTKAQYDTLVKEGEVTIDGTTITYSEDAVYFVTDESASSAVAVDTELDPTSDNPIANSAVANAIAGIEPFTVTTMPDATTNSGRIVMYVGDSSGDYTKGRMYTSDGAKWIQRNNVAEYLDYKFASPNEGDYLDDEYITIPNGSFLIIKGEDFNLYTDVPSGFFANGIDGCAILEAVSCGNLS
jgi:hypothetical protein